eukprot:1157543-Pelagomonas_calceolata.AAC.9
MYQCACIEFIPLLAHEGKRASDHARLKASEVAGSAGLCALFHHVFSWKLLRSLAPQEARPLKEVQEFKKKERQLAEERTKRLEEECTSGYSREPCCIQVKRQFQRCPSQTKHSYCLAHVSMTSGCAGDSARTIAEQYAPAGAGMCCSHAQKQRLKAP